MPKYEKKREVDTRELSEDTIFALLSVERRRELLRILERSGDEAPLADITAKIADREHGIDSNPAKRKAVYVSLHQTHIPRLEEAGVLEHDVVNRIIRLTGPWKQLYAYLEFNPMLKKQGLLSRVFRPQGGRKTN